jgi:ribosomal subunit interface protein
MQTMQVPLQITFRNLPPSEAIASRINQQFAKLYRFCDHIINCQVVVEIPHQHHHKGNPYHIRIKLTLPGEELIINQDSSDKLHKNVYVAIREAFDAAQQKVKRFADVQKV